MAIIKLQSEADQRKGICYRFNTEDQPIGVGGMGKVYKGVCVNEITGTTRPVAVKFMYDDLPAHAYERARRESEIQLRNDNLVAMLGFFETQDRGQNGEIRKHYHVVSELLTGVSLSDLLEGKTKDRNGEEVPFAMKMRQDYQNDPEHFARIVVLNVLSGLMALHDAGYIHRDIDPSNIMLTADGHIKLIDYGIAKQMNNLTTGDKALTVAGKFMGKPEYAAPELALGDIDHQNQTTDIYAVGILLYQCLVGHTPFEGARYEILEKQLKEKIPLDIIKNNAFKKIIATACEKKQDRRYQSAAQMRVALETISINTTQNHSLYVKVAFGILCLAVFLAGFMMTIKLLPTEDVEPHRTWVESDSPDTTTLTESSQPSDNGIKNLDQIKMMVAKADSLAELGYSKEDEDHYEKQMMQAYNIYIQAEQLASSSSNINYPVDKLAKKRERIMKQLDSAIDNLINAAEELEQYEEFEFAEKFRNRAESIVEFKNKQQ